MKILFLSPAVPHPQTDGGRQRIHSILDALVGAHDVTFVGIGREADLRSSSLSSRLSRDSFVVALDDDSSGDRLGLPWRARPMGVARLERAGLWTRLMRLPLASYEAVHAETTLLAPFAAEVRKRHGRAALLIDLPDITSHYRTRLIMRNKAALLHPRSLREMVQIAQLYALESRLFPQAEAIFVCSDIDRARIVNRVPADRVIVVPNGTHVGESLPPPPLNARELVFIGTMSYAPNDEGVRYFVHSVWPRVRRAVPDARFVIVGKSPPPDVLALDSATDGISVTGEVDDVRPYLARAAASVVPLLSGGGTRLKILESMAAGRAVVSTTVGAEGIEAVPNREILIADTAADLAAACIRVLTDPDLRDRLVTEARRCVEARYDWRTAQQRVLGRYSTLDAAPAR